MMFLWEMKIGLKPSEDDFDFNKKSWRLLA